MRILNGTPVIDKEAIQRGKVSNPLLSTLRGIGGLVLLSDGTLGNVSPRDMVTGVPFTMAGGVGGAWTEESNWRTLMGMGVRAPVIAGATDNLLSDSQASMEDSVDRTSGRTDCTTKVIATDGWHGTHCLAVTATGTNSRAYYDIKALTATGSQYTLSCRVKAGNAAAVGKQYYIFLYGNTSGATNSGNITLTTEWQIISVTKTFAAEDTANRYCYPVRAVAGTSVAGDIVLVDAIQLEAGATASPFALNSRTAVSCSIANPLTAGATSFTFAANEPWAGNDGVLHVLLDCGSYKVMKTAANDLTFEITDAAAGVKSMSIAVTAVNMAANTNHVIQCGHDGAGNPWVNLNGTAGAVAAGAGTGIPAAPGATLYIGTDDAGVNPWNGAVLAEADGRITSANERAYLARMTQWYPDMSVVGVY